MSIYASELGNGDWGPGSGNRGPATGSRQLGRFFFPFLPNKKAALRQQVDYCLFIDASSSNAQHTSSCFSSFTTTSFSTCCSFIVYSASIKSTRFLAGHQHFFYVDTHISLMSIIYIFYTPLSNIPLTKFVFSLESSFMYFIAYIAYKIFVHLY